MNYFGFQGWLSPPRPPTPSPPPPSSSIRSAFPGSRCRPTRECRLRIAQRISDTFLKCKTFRLRVRREGEDGGGARRMARILIASTLYETFRQALYSPSRASDFFFFFFFLLFLVFLTRSRDRVGLRIFVLECKFRFYSMNERS